MNKKGFTLLELLGVVVILSLLVMIATVGITKTVKNSKEKLSKTQLDSIRIAAELWGSDNTKYLPNNGECIYITLSDLQTYGYIDKDVIDISTNEVMEDLNIKITTTSDKFNNLKYTYEVNSNDISDCNKINSLLKENVEAATKDTVTTGIVPITDENGNIVVGSEFKIKVNEEIGFLTFFVLSNDLEYVNLIAQKNLAPDGSLAGENQTGDEWYESLEDNRYGPQTAYTYLSTSTSSWINIPIIENFSYIDEGNQIDSTYGYQSIVTTLDSTTGNYITTITPLSTDYGNPVTYKNMRARLPKYNEIIENTSCIESEGSCPLWAVDYLNTSEYVSGGTSSTSYSVGYWLLSSYPCYSNLARTVIRYGRLNNAITTRASYGVRPVITVLKSDLLRVM